MQTLASTSSTVGLPLSAPYTPLLQLEPLDPSLWPPLASPVTSRPMLGSLLYLQHGSQVRPLHVPTAVNPAKWASLFSTMGLVKTFLVSLLRTPAKVLPKQYVGSWLFHALNQINSLMTSLPYPLSRDGGGRKGNSQILIMASRPFNIRVPHPLSVCPGPISCSSPAWSTSVFSHLFEYRNLLWVTRPEHKLFPQTLPVADNVFSYRSQLQSQILGQCSWVPVWCETTPPPYLQVFSSSVLSIPS